MVVAAGRSSKSTTAAGIYLLAWMGWNADIEGRGLGIENLIDLKVKVIRCDNGTEFKNRIMNQFCEMKGIKREFSIARTPQQNEVAKRKPALRFMRPFGCHVTILNTIDHLGKFNGNADEGFFVGYSTNSKEFRVFNSRTRIVEENLHVQYKRRMLDSKSYPDAGFKPSGEEEKKDVEDPGNESGNPTEGKDSEVPKVNVVDPKTSIELLNDLNMPELEDIVYSVMIEDTLVDLPNGKRAIGTKWVYRNKKDKRGIVIKNKARLVAQGYTQEKKIDYDEVFSPVARIEAIRLFLAYALFKDFVVYQMDVKGAFLYGKIEEEVYVCKPPGFEDPDFPNIVYKVEKALYGVHQTPRSWTASEAEGGWDFYLKTKVMSSASSTVTYTSVYTDSEPGRPVAPLSPDYIPGPEEPQTPPVPHDEDKCEPMFIQPHDPDYVPEPMYSEYIPLEDEHVFPAEEQPLPPVVSPTAESLGYVVESDPEEDPEEYEGDETEDGPVDYPMDGGEDGDDDDDGSHGDDADDEDEDEDKEDEEEEDLAPGDSAVVVPIVKLVSPPEGTEHVTPPPSTDITTTGARITVRLQASISLLPEAEVERLLSMPTPPPSPPISLSPPSVGERLARCTAPSAHSSPPPVPSSLLPSSGCLTQIQTLRIASTQALVDAVTVALPSPPPPPPLPPSLYIPPPVDRRDDIPESEWPPHKRSCLFALGPRYEVEDSSTARPTGGQGVDYGDTWVDPTEVVPEIAPMTVGEVNTRVTKLAELHEHDTQDLYSLLEDAKDSRTLISQRVTIDSQWVDLLMEDRIAHQETVLIVEEEAYASREAWAHAIGLSQAVHYELQTHRKQVYAHESQLHAHRTQLQLQGTVIQTQYQIVETLRVMRDMRREMGDMQAELLALREQQTRARQPGPDVRVPDH
ncbi:putative reverse transcriptase domain-containing protein [Tanacetum coccineum]